MPVFQETAAASRDFRIHPSLERPLPRLTPRPVKSQDGAERYEVVVIGAGPAGLMLTLLLARYGLGDSLMCFDAKPGTLKAGQADGLQPRTLEVLKSLDISHEILDHGCHMSEVAFWNPKGTQNGGIERTSFVPDVVVAARYKHEVTIHQGRIERIMEENLQLYSKVKIQRSTKFVSFRLNAAQDSEYPIHIEVDKVSDDGSTQRRTVRAKHLVGADGAHSQVRRSMGQELRGDTTDHIWGVVDFVAETNFPDVRKRCAIHSDEGSVMIIPRERISSRQYLTRLYVQVKEEVPADESFQDDNLSKIKAGKRRAAITLDYIMTQAKLVLAPYTISIKSGTTVDWWAAYQIGQRMTSKFSMADENGLERVFIVGDACHTHSPKAGQGMNVSMMDSYNLAWKMTHTLHGLSPMSTDGHSSTILQTFEDERLAVAKQLIEFDTKFSSMFSGKIGSEPSVDSLTHSEFLKVFSDGSGFTSGCGVEYPRGVLVEPMNTNAPGSTSPIKGDDYLQGVIKPGRRLLDSVVRRYADANIRHLQDDLPSTGRYRIIVFTTEDLTQPHGVSVTAVENICHKIIPIFPTDTIELVVLHPFRQRSFEWEEIPSCVKDFAEMTFHGLIEDADTYGTYGISEEKGALVVVRPDGYVGIAKMLDDTESVRRYFEGCLVQIA